jgi:hypothetical protein
MFAVSQIVSSPLRGKIKMGVLFGYSAAISNSPLFDSPPLSRGESRKKLGALGVFPVR